MVDLTPTLTNTLTLLGTTCFIIIIAYLTVGGLNKIFGGSKKAWATKLVIGVVFGLLAIYSTVIAVKLPDGTIPNVRELATMMAGFAGGPVGGVIAGLIGGLHRFSLGGATAAPCGAATILVGAISGFVSIKLTGKWMLIKAAVTGFVLESFALGLLFALLPYETAWSVTSQVYIPMVTASTVGLILWTYFFEKIRKKI